MTLHTFAVLVEDVASDEATHFAVEASSPLIACTRAAMRIFGPDAETRPVYGCAACGEELWEADGLDSSGFRFCADCSPDDLESREEQEPIGVAVGRDAASTTARISATEILPLPGDAPMGGLTVAVGEPGLGLRAGESFEDDAEARDALQRAVGGVATLDDALGEVTVKDEVGAYFRYRLRAIPESVDAHDLAARGLIAAPDEEEDEEGEGEDGE